VQRLGKRCCSFSTMPCHCWFTPISTAWKPSQAHSRTRKGPDVHLMVRRRVTKVTHVHDREASRKSRGRLHAQPGVLASRPIRAGIEGVLCFPCLLLMADAPCRAPSQQLSCSARRSTMANAEGVLWQDTRVALAYGPRHEDVSTWPHAHAAHSASLEATKVHAW
jgi:hypothetical protein